MCRNPDDSAAQYPAGSGLGVSVLLRQPHGFERFAFESQTVKGPAKRQVVLDSKKAAVTQPIGPVTSVHRIHAYGGIRGERRRTRPL
jgi:hypothetical protein